MVLLDNVIDYEKEKTRIKDSIEGKLRRHFGKSIEDATKNQLYKACAMTIRDEIMEKWTNSAEEIEEQNGKQLYYLSVEFLMGRALGNNIMNFIKSDVYKDACSELGISIDSLEETEPDAGLGNGGLGRLAACFMDSLTTLGLPGTGCSIRYEYGLFKQRIIDGYQIEMPDPWLEDGSIWEIQKPEEQEEVRYGGRIIESYENGKLKFKHEGYHSVMAIPYDVPVTGYKSKVVNSLRLWSARSPKYIDMGLFSRGDYRRASEEKEIAEVISKVLYPEDNHYEGKALRLKQHYFFVSATMQYIVRKHKLNNKLKNLPDKVAVHINDTHPSLAIPELMRILVDIEGMEWEEAWDITTRTFAYTNHTIMSEALERWPVQLFKEQLPRIYMIICEINERYCKMLWNHFPGQWDKISSMAIIAYDELRMANLCMAGSHSINGVSELHTEILKNQVFNDFYRVKPENFCSITNGITHRRWLLHANPGLASLINDSIGDGWILNPVELEGLSAFADDSSFKEKFGAVKRENKVRLAEYIKDYNNVIVDPDSIFDVQVKRLHEYKRQLLNIFHIMYLYNRLTANPNSDIHPRTFIFGAKASPGYQRAKLIIKLINTIADKINNDKSINGKLKVVFLEDYKVSLAEKIMPAAELSEQLSTAGKEASGTGNMKFMLNGALTVGTLDGANIEIKELVGSKNIFIFGLTASQINKFYEFGGYDSREIYEQNAALKTIIDQLINGFFTNDNTKIFNDIYHSLLFKNGNMADPYFVLKDFESYVHIQERVDRKYRKPESWNRKAIINVAKSGYFSSDRTVAEYNNKIWNLQKVDF
jgi:starch phosphorylase